ncbi:MAG TPA: DUF433 domain-containing protein [Anaerolineales bacterium]|nr:DUF433 domain-containing protein [Anaerolineales bacterium]
MKLHAKKERTVQHPYIEKKAGVCGGEPVIKGTRIRVSLIAELERAGQSVDEIIASYPHLNHAQVYDALSYYYENKSALNRQSQKDQALVAELKTEYASKLRTHKGWQIQTYGR